MNNLTINNRGSPRYGPDLTKKPIFGKLKVISYAGKNKHNQSCWNCECSCGNKTVVATSSLTSGHTRSCGCLKLKAKRSSTNENNS